MTLAGFPVQSVGGRDVLIAGGFRPNAATGVIAGSGKGEGYTVARTSAGLYTLTFTNRVYEIKSALAGGRDASGVPIAVQFGDYDADAKTLQMRVFRRAQAADSKGFIPLDISTLREIVSDDIQNLAAHGGDLASDQTPTLLRVNAATDKALRATWAAANVSEVQFGPVAIPEDYDNTANMTVHLLAAMAGATDIPVIDVQAWSGIGDTEMGGNTAAVTGTTIAEYSVALTGANVGAHPGFLNIGLVPAAHGTDALFVYAAWLEYTRLAKFELADLAADVDNEIHFQIVASEAAGARHS